MRSSGRWVSSSLVSWPPSWLSSARLVAAALRAGLRPLEIASRQIRRLDADSLDARVSLDLQPTELLLLLEYLNGLLERLNIAFVRERALSSNLAHELRTPTTELRNLSEIGFRWPSDVSAVRRYFEDTREIANQMERMVVRLLSLSRWKRASALWQGACLHGCSATLHRAKSCSAGGLSLHCWRCKQHWRVYGHCWLGPLSGSWK